MPWATGVSLLLIAWTAGRWVPSTGLASTPAPFAARAEYQVLIAQTSWEWAGEQKRDELLVRARAWGRQDPEGALMFLNEWTGGQVSHPLVAAALTGWAESDAPAAAAWLDDQTENEDNLVAALVAGSAAGHPEMAAQRFTGMAAGPAKEKALESILHHLWKKDPARARTWLESLSVEDPALKSRAWEWWRDREEPLEGALSDLAPVSPERREMNERSRQTIATGLVP